MMRFASLAAACALTACVLPSTDERVSEGGDSRERAARHAQLSMAYLRHARADVAHTEALMAWRLAPDDVGIVHLMALNEAAKGRSDAALGFFAHAVALDEARRHAARAAGFVGKRLEGRVPYEAHEQSPSEAQGAIKDLSERAILWSNYAVALKAAGQAERAACFSARALRYADAYADSDVDEHDGVGRACVK